MSGEEEAADVLDTPPSNQPGGTHLRTHTRRTWHDHSVTDRGRTERAVPRRRWTDRVVPGPAPEVLPGSPAPLGAHWDGTGTNFALWSSGAHAVDLCLFDEDGTEHRHRLQENTHQVWHGRLPGVGPGQRYGYRVRSEEHTSEIQS